MATVDFAWAQIGEPGDPPVTVDFAWAQIGAPVPGITVDFAWAQIQDAPTLAPPNAPSAVDASATGATAANATLTDNTGGAASYRWEIQQVGGSGSWVAATVTGGNPSGPGVAAVALTGLPVAGEFLLRARAELFGGLVTSAWVYAPFSFWTDNPATGGGEIPTAPTVAVGVTGQIAHVLTAAATATVGAALPTVVASLAGSLTHSVLASMQAGVADPIVGGTRAPPGRRLIIGSADTRSGYLASRFYPFDPQDQLDFEWEFEFDPTDGDGVASCPFVVDPGLSVVTSYVVGNRVTCWVKTDPLAPPAELALLGVTARMTSASVPPRKVDATVFLQIRSR